MGGSWFSLRARTLPLWRAAASSPNTTSLPLRKKILLTATELAMLLWVVSWLPSAKAVTSRIVFPLATGLHGRLSSNQVARFHLEHANTWQVEAARTLIVSRCVHMLSRGACM